MNRKRQTKQRLTGFVSCLVMLAVGNALAASEVMSEPLFAYVHPEKASFWRTATNNVVSLNVFYPDGVGSASLMVRGVRYAVDYPSVAEGTLTLTLPPAHAPEFENVYELVLAYDDGTTNHVTLGVIDGVKAGAEGSTRCILSEDSRSWSRVGGRAVLPVPYGTTSFTVDDQPVETGLDGAQGWYAWEPLAIGATYSLKLVTDAGSYDAELRSVAGGLIILVH